MKRIKPMLPCQEEREDLISLVLRRKEETWIRYDAMDIMNLGIIERIVPNLIRTRGKRKKPMSPEKWKNQIQRNLRRRSERSLL